MVESFRVRTATTKHGVFLCSSHCSVLYFFRHQWKTSKDSDKSQWTLSDPEIHALAGIAATSTLYCPFFCLGELQTSVDSRDRAVYSPHAFVVLVPKSVMKKDYKDRGHGFADDSGGDSAPDVQFSGGDDIPSILVESTSYTDGAWTREALEDSGAEERFREAYAPFLSEKSLPIQKQHFRRAMKPKAPVIALRLHRIYRHIFCAITPMASKYRKNGKHETFVFPVGTKIEDFLMRSGVVARSIHKSGKDEERGILRRWLSVYPYGSLTQKAPRKLETIASLTLHAERNRMVEGGMGYTGRCEELAFIGDKQESKNKTAIAIHKVLVQATQKDFRSMPIEILRDLRTVVVGETA